MSTSALFVALSIYDRPAGIQRFNQRLVRALGELPSADLERAAVLSLVDREPRDLGARLEFVACGVSRLRLVAEQIRRLRSVKFDVLILGHMNLLPLAALARGEFPEEPQRNIPLLGRMAQPEEVAYPILWLASDEASYITGQVISVNGGMT